MSVSSGFFNSINHDRVYDAVDFSRIFDGLIQDGVYSFIGDTFMVRAYTGMKVSVASGRAWFNSTWILNDDTIIVDLEDAEVALNRWDAIVIEVDQNERECRISSVKGTPAQDITYDDTDHYPTLSRGNGLYQYPLAYVLIESGVVSITNADIKVVIGTSMCPFVTGLLETTTIDHLWQNWDQQFNEWFDHIKGQLDTDAAGHLQNEIDEMDAAKSDRETYVNLTLGSSGWNNRIYSFESTYPSSQYDILDVLPNEGTTSDQRKAYLAADIGGYYTTNIIKANGQVPSIGIPVTLVLRTK